MKFKNFAKSELSSQLLVGGTSLNIQTGVGTTFPDTGSTNIFRGVIWGASFITPFDDATREVVEAYRSAGDAFAIVRAQEGTSAKQWEVGDNFMLTLTAEKLDEIFSKTDKITNASASAPASLDLAEDTDNGTNKITVTAPSAVASDKVLTLPDATGTIALLEIVYPIGSVYINYSDSTNPGTLLGFGTWVATAVGRAIVGIDAGQTEFDTAGETGGAKTHTLSLAETPNRTGQISMHDVANATTIASVSGAFSVGALSPRYFEQGAGTAGATSVGLINFNNGGGGGAHNNLQPYQVFYIWRRTA